MSLFKAIDCSSCGKRFTTHDGLKRFTTHDGLYGLMCPHCKAGLMVPAPLPDGDDRARAQVIQENNALRKANELLRRDNAELLARIEPLERRAASARTMAEHWRLVAFGQRGIDASEPTDG